MSKKFFVIIVLLFLSIPAIGQSTTVWGPGENYKIGYLYSANFYKTDEIILQFENQPIIEFVVANFTNTHYDYIYTGYGNLTYSKKVYIVASDSLEYPTGAFPVILPISFSDHENWLSFFASQTLNNTQNILDSNFLLNSSTHEENDRIYFEKNYFSSTEDFTAETSIDAIKFLVGDKISTLKLYNCSISVDLGYEISTGALYYLNYTLFGEEETSSEDIFISEQLDFVAIFPFIAITDSLNFNYLFFLGTLCTFPVFLAYRKRIWYSM